VKTPLAVRIAPDLLAAARECARRDNRTLTNFIETALRDRITQMMPRGLADCGHSNLQGAKDTMRDA